VVDECNKNNNSKKVCLGCMHHAQTSLSIHEPSDATIFNHVSSYDDEVPNQSVGIVSAYSTLMSIGGLECGQSSKGMC
jgi:uncharacterized protein YgiB involved in biofilm formation